MSPPPLLFDIVLLLLGLVVFVALRAMAMVRHADEQAARQWDDLARLQSESGIAFFPTLHARLELELAISELVELEPRVERVRVARARAPREIAGAL